MLNNNVIYFNKRSEFEKITELEKSVCRDISNEY